MFTVAQEELKYKHIQYDQSSFTSIKVFILKCGELHTEDYLPTHQHRL